MARKLHPIIRELKAARRLVARKNGWCQGKYSQKAGKITQYCAEGAVFASRPFGQSKEDVQMPLLDLLDDTAGRRSLFSCVTFNDKPGRKQEQVVRLFDRAIAKAEKLEAKGKL